MADVAPVAGFFSGFVGSAPVETYLLGYAGRPPAAYMGAKTQYRAAILGAMGLRFGQGAERSVWCDGGPWGLVWQVLATPGGADAVAARLRSWAGEDPRALWERLAREPVPDDAVEAAAATAWVQARSVSSAPVGFGESAFTMGERGRLTEARQRGRWNSQRAGNMGSDGMQSVETVAARIETVARFLALQSGGAHNKPVGLDGDGWRTHGYGHLSDSARDKGFRDRLLVNEVARRVAPVPGSLEVVNADIAAALALLPEDLAGWHAYLDPPYVGCTPYALDCPRERVVGIALDLARRGAVVAVSEGVPVEELTAVGWHALDIGHVRRSQRWTARQAGEWLTLSRAPVAIPARQERLFE